MGWPPPWAEKAPHNAFTDLTSWKGKFYCVFREASRQVGDTNGKIRVLVSQDGEKWTSAAALEEKGIDLRDHKVCPAPFQARRDHGPPGPGGEHVTPGFLVPGETALPEFPGPFHPPRHGRAQPPLPWKRQVARRHKGIPYERPPGKKGMATVLLEVDETGAFRRLLELPSGGDTSYPGFLLKDHTLWVSYYSSHQGKTSIYLAKLE